jgi:micrococcal nuclease
MRPASPSQQSDREKVFVGIFLRQCTPLLASAGGRVRLVLLVFAAFLLVACQSSSTADVPADATAAATGRARQTARVVRVIDGDTILVDLNGREERVRYIGVDTPETVAQDRPVGCFGPEASRKNKELVEGKSVELERDVSDRDRFDRLLRYVYVDGVMINAELLQQGYGTSVTFPPDVRENSRFRALEREARQARRGLWSACR